MVEVLNCCLAAMVNKLKRNPGKAEVVLVGKVEKLKDIKLSPFDEV